MEQPALKGPILPPQVLGSHGGVLHSPPHQALAGATRGRTSLGAGCGGMMS